MKFADVQEKVYTDCEYTERPGENPELICVVGYNTKTRQWFEYWFDEIPLEAPFSKDAVVIGFAMSSDISCIERHGWRARKFIDLHVEYRLHNNEIGTKPNTTLLSALDHFRISHIGTSEKDRIRQICIRGGPFSAEERAIILPYCKTDVVPLPALAENLLGQMDAQQFAQALARGRFVWAVSHVERNGIPLNMPLLRELECKWDNLLLSLIFEVDQDYHVYDGTTFKFEAFSDYLSQRNIAWSKTPKGRLKSDDETFRSMSIAYPDLNPLRELRATLSTMKHWKLAVGSDGRNRTSLRPCTTQTARNAPSTTASIFGPAVCWRNLITPPPGYHGANCDIEQEEFGISMWLSKCANGIEAYEAGDVYLAFAKQVGAIPPQGTKETHRQIRDRYKQVILAVGYGQKARALSQRLGCSETQAQILLDQHHKIYSDFWAWSDRVVATMQLRNEISTRSGWRIRKTGKLNAHEERSVRNFLVQSTASNVLHVVAPMVVEANIEAAMLIHDAVLIFAPAAEIKAQARQVQEMMAAASRQVLGGFALRTDVKFFDDHYKDERGDVLGIWSCACSQSARCRNVNTIFLAGEIRSQGLPQL